MRVLGSVVGDLGDAEIDTERDQRHRFVNSRGEGIVEINNPFLGEKIVLDLSDQWHPKRTSETGEVEFAGANHGVWVDFSWSATDSLTGFQITSQGNFFRCRPECGWNSVWRVLR
jgi:hypothetical protein